MKRTAGILSKLFLDADIYAVLYFMNIASTIEKDAARQKVQLIRDIGLIR